MRKVIYVTGTRADYGLMKNTLKMLNSSPKIKLSICITGMHLLPEFGNTETEIEGDEINICERIRVDLDSISGESMAKALSIQLSEMLKVFQREEPNIVLLLGDRGEMLAAAIAAVHLNIPIAHIHGGERSGSIDESIRHAITKLSHYHFVATEFARKRLVRMGELSKNIHITGAPGIDGLTSLPFKDKGDLCYESSFNPEKPLALVVFHPVVQEALSAGKQAKIILEAIFDSELQSVCLMPNSDAGGSEIRAVLNQYKDKKDFLTYTHLPREVYISWMKAADLMIGNSSSGIIEAASFGLKVINIGMRQNKRERGENVVDVDIDPLMIKQAIKKALKSPRISNHNIYGNGSAGSHILNLLETLPLSGDILNKCNAY